MLDWEWGFKQEELSFDMRRGNNRCIRNVAVHRKKPGDEIFIELVMGFATRDIG